MFFHISKNSNNCLCRIPKRTTMLSSIPINQVLSVKKLIRTDDEGCKVIAHMAIKPEMTYQQPFRDLNIASSDFLNSIQGRSECPKCKRSRKYYCYTCYIPVDQLEGNFPIVKLPLKVDIIKHPSEVDGKSTSAHGKVLAPTDVEIFTYPCIPDYPRDGSVVLVFPGENACTLDELVEQSVDSECDYIRKSSDCSTECQSNRTLINSSHVIYIDERCIENLSEQQECSKIVPLSTAENPTDSETTSYCTAQTVNSVDQVDKYQYKDFDRGVKRKRSTDKIQDEKPQPLLKKAIFIDSTWNQTSRISNDERLKGKVKETIHFALALDLPGMPCVVLKDQESKFWRHQKENPSTYLSTIEAIYYLVRDYHQLFISSNYSGEYDNLLFLFNFMYQKIHGLYSGKDLKADLQRKKIN